jgi:hypothetical protein
MTGFSPRLPHLFPPRTLARLLVATYAEAAGVDEEEAHERLTLALRSPALVQDLQSGIAAALAERQGPRTPTDRLLDRISAALEKRGGRVRAAPVTPGLSAVIVRIHLELGLAPEPMRATLATPRGAAAVEQGLGAVGAHLVKELLR